MAFRLSSALALASLFASTIADWEPIQEFSWYKDYFPTPEDYCFNACYTAADYVTFNVTATSEDYYVNLCSNDLKIKSIFYCAQKYCTHKEAVSGRNQLSPSCEGDAGSPLPTVESMLISQEELEQIPVINSTTGLATAPPDGVALNTPILPDQQWLDLSYRTVVSHQPYELDLTPTSRLTQSTERVLRELGRQLRLCVRLDRLLVSLEIQ